MSADDKYRSAGRPAPELPTLTTVAAAAGVSRQTVSNALNNPGLLRHDTLVRTPPQNIDSTLSILGWVDEVLDVFRVQLRFGL